MSKSETPFEGGIGDEYLSYGVEIICDFTQRDGSPATMSGHALPIRQDADQPALFSDDVRQPLDLKAASESVRSFFPFGLAFVTCRHLVDRVYAAEVYGSRLHSLKITYWHEERQHIITYSKDCLDVWIPENDKLDLAILSINAEGLSVTILNTISYPKSLCVIPLHDLVEFCQSIDLGWGAKVGFTSKQPWTGEHPILRTGIVSSNPRVDFQSPDVPRDHIYLLEAQSFSGSSGSPVWSYPVGSPISGSFRVGGRPLPPYKPPCLIGIMLGHINNDKSGIDVINRLPVGLSYCHKLSTIFMLLMGMEPTRLL